MGSKLGDVISKRKEYWGICNRTLLAASYPETGVYCNGSFDNFACWPHSPPGNVSVPCPSYLSWAKQDGAGRVYKECLSSGSWRARDNSSEDWRDDSECKNLLVITDEEEKMFQFSVLRVVSMVGYSMSFSSLSIAMLVMGLLRKLHCTRNYIHMNLFVSFMLRAMAVITKEVILQAMHSSLTSDAGGWNSYSDSVTALLCKGSRVAMEYFVSCNYFWLLVEAIFLHTLLFTTVLTKRRLLQRYMLIGWGTPIFFVVPWLVAKTLYENEDCWSNSTRLIWWIIRGPITLAVLIIFYIFLKILKLLLSKLKADQVKFTDYRYSLARATLVLIPLLGIHEVVFALIMDEYVEGRHRYVRNFIHLTLSSFQGFLVAVLYCFANGEVQGELKKRWQLFRLARRLEVHSCCHRMRPGILQRCHPGHPGHTFAQNELGGAGVDHARPQTEPMAVQSAGQVQQGHGRKSLSSSDGEMTLGETMEEILEESAF
ncbi:glucagon-like peptide 2 receptor [Denticeps clupeoides]|uniref:glucagon-like peptide 2 receptor n=1 Tax=Denticeps clupeoides TaxID=299321 RepID=UPI0010A55DA9|nr:glucagon-like peptide 2 receptor [Denticeps clupeoides]